MGLTIQTPDRDAGLAQGLILTFVPTTITVTTCVVLPILPAIVQAFPKEARIAELVPLVAVLPILAVALTSIAAGVLGDGIGRRNLLIIGAAVFAVSALAPLWLTSFTLILVSRAIAGLAIGVMITSAVALTGDYYSGATLQRWLGAQAGASAISGVVVSFASGALGELNWRYAFLPLLMGPLLFIGLLTIPAPKWALADGARSETAVKAHSEGPAPWMTWFYVYVLAILGTAIIFPPAFELGALLQEKALGSSSVTGAAVAVLAAGSAVAAFSLSWLRRLSAQIKVGLAMASTAVGTFIIASSTALIPLMSGAVLVGASQGVLGPVLSIWLLERTPQRLRGRAVGIYQTLTFLTLFLAPLLARHLAVVLQSPSAAMRTYSVAALAVSSVIAPSFFHSRHPHG